MSVVYRIFIVDFHKLARAVVNLLIKSHRHLVGVNLFDVPSLPPLPAQHIKLVSVPTGRECFPMGEFPFVLIASTHLIL